MEDTVTYILKTPQGNLYDMDLSLAVENVRTKFCAITRTRSRLVPPIRSHCFLFFQHFYWFDGCGRIISGYQTVCLDQ